MIKGGLLSLEARLHPAGSSVVIIRCSSIDGDISLRRPQAINIMEAQFFRFLKIVGVGFKARAESEGRLLFLKLGYSHEVELSVPPAVRVFCFKPNIVCCTGIDKQRVHQFAAAVRGCKPPEVYKGKGIMYVDEVIKKKQGKKSK
ncbi:hypothetical protein LXL04_005278 [Taraxacum kok-saghyz]